MINFNLEITPKSINRHGKVKYYLKDKKLYSSIKDQDKYPRYHKKYPENALLSRLYWYLIQPKYLFGYQLQFSYESRYTKKQSLQMDKKEQKQRVKELIAINKIQQQQITKREKLFNTGLTYDKTTGIITSGNIPIIKNIENGYEHIYYDDIKIASHRLLFQILKIDIKGFDVHHTDLNKRNNKFNNLQLLTRKQHMSLHSKMRSFKPKKGLI